MKTLYFDCFAGASGNMILGALLALGVDRNELERQLSGLSISDFSLVVTKVDRSGISSTHVDVQIPPETKHRHLHNVEAIIDNSQLSDAVKERSKAIFRKLAAAEAEVHGIEIQKVHFHEVGALDAIVDVVGACIGFEMLGVERFAASKLHVGSGFVTMEHGTYPVPPPAVANLLKGIPAYATEIQGELLTPTGAAIISTLCDTYGPLPEMKVEATGYGAGTRQFEKFPNVVRLFVGTVSEENRRAPESSKPEPDLEREDLVLMETNIDDLSPQVAGYVLERALQIGALDCWTTPIQMKKNRPAFLLSILCSEDSKPSIQEMLFLETTTLGIRESLVCRSSLAREVRAVITPYGPVDVKTAIYRGKLVNLMPEYEHVKQAAQLHGVPFKDVHSAAVAGFAGGAIAAGS